MQRLERWSIIAVMMACLGQSGCCSWNLRGETPPDTDMTKEVRQFRQPDKDVQFSGFSNKARSIEQNLGVIP